MYTVTIYERVKRASGWTTVSVELPKLRKKDGKPFLSTDRQGRFRISWYENRKKLWVQVPPRFRGELPYLSDAIKYRDDKQWFLNNRERNVQDPTKIEGRRELQLEAERYLAAKSGCKKTLSAHDHALTEFIEWAEKPKAGRALRYVDEITKALLKTYYEYLVDGNREEEGPNNSPFTAANKLMKINAFYREVFDLEPGKGVIKKSDYKRELKTSKEPEIYSKQELEAMFSVMDSDEHLVFSTLLEAGLRKRELMFLEDADLIYDELVPGLFKCEIRVQPKPHWKFQTKTGGTRNVSVSKELMDRLLARRATTRRSKLLFGIRTGQPNYHLWDALKAIAKRAGLDPTTVWLHKFRSTAATRWLRSPLLGGKGRDIGFVRQQLGHEDSKSIEHYFAMVKTEEVVLMEHQQTLKAFAESGQSS